MEKKAKKEFSPGAVLATYWPTFKRHWVASLIAVLGIIGGSVVSIITPLYYKQLLDLIAAGGAAPRLAAPLIAVLLLILVINVVGWLMRRSAQFAIVGLEADGLSELTQLAFGNLLTHSYTFFTNNFAGSLVRKVSRLSRSFEDICDRFFFTFLPLIVSVGGIIIVLFARSVVLGSIFLIWTILLVSAQVILAIYRVDYGLKAAEKDSESTGAISDAISNETAVKLFTGVQYERERFGTISRALNYLQRRAWFFDEYVSTIQGFLAIAIEFALMYAGIILWQRGVITIGDFALIQAYIISAVDQLWNFGNTLRRIYESFADATEMVNILNLPNDVQDIPGAKDLVVHDAAIQFRDVSFDFAGKHSVLEHFDLSIESMEKVALVGSSGAGKTTITKLLLRLFDVNSGGVFIDDQNIGKVAQESLRSSISLVPQEPALFHRSLMENIRYGKRDATDAEVIEAAKQAHCYEFISKYPQGFDTFVGERGVKLSGGERQRVAIARAILKNAPILILDEATSSLDSESEALIQDALAKLMQGKTVIAIAHRLSTIMKMDRIIVMDAGKAILSGTHAELLAQESNLYKKLWEIQAGGFIIDSK